MAKQYPDIHKKITPQQKKKVDKAFKITIKQYGKAIRKLHFS